MSVPAASSRFALRRQLEAIRKELGEDGGGEAGADDYRTRAAGLDLPEPVATASAMPALSAVPMEAVGQARRAMRARCRSAGPWGWRCTRLCSPASAWR